MDPALVGIEATLRGQRGRVGREGAQVVRRNAHRLEALAKLNAPVDTGALRNSIGTSQVGDGRSGGITATVSTSLSYSFWVETGTSRMAPRAYMGPALDRVAPDFLDDCRRLTAFNL
jgi:HK97 gp10 family phage protein